MRTVFLCGLKVKNNELDSSEKPNPATWTQSRRELGKQVTSAETSWVWPRMRAF